MTLRSCKPHIHTNALTLSRYYLLLRVLCICYSFGFPCQFGFKRNYFTPLPFYAAICVCACMHVCMCVYVLYCDMAAAAALELVHWLMAEAEVAGGPRAPTQFAIHYRLHVDIYIVYICMYVACFEFTRK